MKPWIFAGLITVMWAPLANAAETTTACDVDDTQRSVQQRIDTSATTARDTRATPGGGSGAAGRRANTETATPTVARSDTTRRRGVTRRIPDAELMRGRGAL